jgi:hypothetical protein
MAGDDDFLKFFSETLANVSGVNEAPSQPPAAAAPPAAAPTPAPAPAKPAAAPAAAVPKGKVVYMGFDDGIRTVFQQNLDKLPFVDTADLQQIKGMLMKNEIALLVFDSTSFIKPGIPITKFIKEKALPVKVAHVYGQMRVTEEYEKYRQYQAHLQPDYRGITDEIFVIIDQIKKDFGL